MWVTPIFFHIIYFYTRHVKWRLSRTLHVAFQEFKSFTIYFSFFRGHNGVRSAIASLGCDVRYIIIMLLLLWIKRSPQTILDQQHFVKLWCGFSKICPHSWDAHVLYPTMCGMRLWKTLVCNLRSSWFMVITLILMQDSAAIILIWFRKNARIKFRYARYCTRCKTSLFILPARNLHQGK